MDPCHPFPQGPPFCAHGISENRPRAQPKSGDIMVILAALRTGYLISYARYRSGGMEIALSGLRRASGILPHPRELLYKLEKESQQDDFLKIVVAESM